MIIKVNKDNFEEIITKNKEIILDFWAPWCNQCKAMDVIIDEIIINYPNIVVGKINVDEEELLTDLFKVKELPHLIKIVDKKYVKALNGLHNEKIVEELFN